MPHLAYIGTRVEIMELICTLNMVISAVFVVTFSGYSIRFPPTVILTLIGSSFCGSMSTTMREYVTVNTTSILLHVTKVIVFLPFLLYLTIRLHVVQILLTTSFARVFFFFYVLLHYICTVLFTHCLNQ